MSDKSLKKPLAIAMGATFAAALSAFALELAFVPEIACACPKMVKNTVVDNTNNIFL